MATTDLVKEVEKRYMKDNLPDVKPGDSVKVKIKIKEGNKERLQAYEGVIIKVRGSGISKTITVRRVFQGVGVERVFLVHSPKVDSIQILRKGDVRRAKLYYLRSRTGKAARIREKIGAVIENPQQQAKGKAQQPQPAAKEEQPVPAEVEAPVATVEEQPAAVTEEAAAPQAEVAQEAPAAEVTEAPQPDQQSEEQPPAEA